MLTAQFLATRRGLLTFLPALWLHGSGLAQSPSGLLPMPTAPTWVLPLWTAQGSASKNLGSGELMGQWVYLDFWASWCGPCKQSFLWMIQLQNQLRDAKLHVIAVGLDKQAAPMERFLKQFPGHVQVVWDPLADTANRFDVQAMPSSYLINPAGQIVWRHRGFQPTDGAGLLQEIRHRINAL
jgi:thiol-disulfide isomerase/thioredoxin